MPRLGELLHRELDEDPLVLRAQDLDLRDVGDMQQLRADILDIVAQFAMREAVAGEAVDDAERVAEIVVEARARRCRPAACGGCRRCSCGRDTRCPAPACAVALPFRLTKMVVTPALREAAQEIEMRRFLQLALEPLGDLLQRLFDGRARPGGLHDHGLDDEGRVLAAAEPVIGQRRRRRPRRS